MLGRKIKESSASIDVAKYLLICEQLGQDPDPEKMPLETSAFPAEVQVAFFIFDLLSDRWDGQSATYLGKDWTSVPFLLDLYEVEDKKVVVYFMKTYEILIVNSKMEEAEKKRKADERKQKAGSGKTFTHNVKG